MLINAVLTRLCVQLKSTAMRKEIAESQSECAKIEKVSVRQILSAMTPVDAPLANCFSLASPAHPETKRQIESARKQRSSKLSVALLPRAPRYFHASSQEYQDLTKDMQLRTKALEAEQVLPGVPRALPPWLISVIERWTPCVFDRQRVRSWNRRWGRCRHCLCLML
jgi:hypothetical protein